MDTEELYAEDEWVRTKPGVIKVSKDTGKEYLGRIIQSIYDYDLFDNFYEVCVYIFGSEDNGIILKLPHSALERVNGIEVACLKASLIRT